jgi:hypothetical protein
MAMADLIFDESMALDKRPSGSRISTHPNGWTDGAVSTVYGFVLVYAQGDAEHFHASRLDFIWHGRLYMRNFSKRRLSARGLVTAANRFAHEVVEGNGNAS